MKRRTLLLALLALAGLMFAACGGEDTLTEEEFLEEANAICSAGNERLQTGAEETFGEVPEGEQPSEEQLAEYLDIFTSEIEGQLDDIEALSPPDDLAEDVDNLIESAREVVEDARDAGPEILLSQEDPFADVNTLAEDIGLSECGSGG